MSATAIPAKRPARVVTLCFLVALVDGYDAQSVGYVGPRLIEDFGIGPAAMGIGFAAALVGLMIGALAISVLADRIGRNPAIILSCVLMGVFSLLTATSPNFEMFVLFRFLTGLGLGGAMPCINALTAEHAPDRWRSTLMTAMFMGVPVGAIAGGVLASRVVPAMGWQPVFVVGGIAPLGLAALLLAALPRETIRPGALAPWRAAVTGLVADEQRRPSLLLWLIFFSNLLLVYALVNWLPVLMEAAGNRPAQAILGPLYFNIGGIVGGVILAPLADRIGAMRLAQFSFAGGCLAIALLGVGLNAAAPPAGAALVGLFVGGTQFIINVIAIGLYPAERRASGIGAAMAIGRLGAIVGPLLVGWLLAGGATPPVVYIVVAGVAALGSAASWALKRHRTVR